jgi:hypothetical protein
MPRRSPPAHRAPPSSAPSAQLRDAISDSPAVLLPGTFHVIVVAEVDVPADAFAVFRDGVEVTAIVSEAQLATVVHHGAQGPFRVLRFELAQPFAAPGFLAAIAAAIARRGVNQLLYSTWSFDYALVATEDLDAAMAGLRDMGFTVLADE